MGKTTYQTERLRHWRTVGHDASFQSTLLNIEEFGWETLLIKGEPESRFAYTAGAYDTLGVPELIVVGLTLETADQALDLAIEQLREGVDLRHGKHREIVGEVPIETRPVTREWYEHLMRRTHWYYGGETVPALQIVYPDLQGRFQWEEGFEEYFRQPLLDSNNRENPRAKDFWNHHEESSVLFNWKFPDPPHTRVFLSQSVHDKREEVTFVSRDADDGAWQFLGNSMADGGGPVISCFHHPIEDDPTLAELHDLPLGWYAVRDSVGESWQRLEHEQPEEPEEE